MEKIKVEVHCPYGHDECDLVKLVTEQIEHEANREDEEDTNE